MPFQVGVVSLLKEGLLLANQELSDGPCLVNLRIEALLTVFIFGDFVYLERLIYF